MKIARRPIVFSLVVVLLQLLIEFGNQAVVALVRSVPRGLQVTGCFKIDNFLEHHALAATFSSSPLHRRKVQLGDIAIVKEGLTKISPVKDDCIRL